MEIIEKTALWVEAFTGCKVLILPVLPMPDDKFCFNEIRGQYESAKLWERIRKAITVPEDALFVVPITNKYLYRWGKRWFHACSKPETGETFITYAHCLRNDYEQISRLLAKFIISFLNKRATGKVCEFKECILSAFSGIDDVRYKKFGLCSDCQKLYKNIDYDTIQKNFRNVYYGNNSNIRYKNGPLGQDDKKEWQNEYNQIVQKVLAEASKKNNLENQKKFDCFPAVELKEKLISGLKYHYFEFAADEVKTAKELASLKPKVIGIIDDFNLSKAKREKNYGLIFEGCIKVPVDGKYQFYITSDDGSRLWIDDKEVLENDKLQAPFTKSAEIALKAGFHRIKVAFLQAGGGAVLRVYFRGPKTLGQQIPAEVLFHQSE